MHLRASLTAVVGVVALASSTTSVPAEAHQRPAPTPGAPGIGDPYFPLDGNGGYDVGHYDLALRYDPADGVLHGDATLRARATQALSRFDLDLVGLDVADVRVDGRRAGWSRDGQELVVTPRRPLADSERFTVEVRYAGVPQKTEDAGFIATDDGFEIAGEPHGAASWYPVNDHPSDKASYSFDVTVPTGLQVVANGDPAGRRTRGGWSTWRYDAPDPMASYLATVDVGRFDLTSRRMGGVRYLDAIDPDLFAPVATPSTGTHFAVSGQADSSYKRLARTLTVPAGGARVGFTITRATEPNYDYAFVEVHTVGQDDWTTLPDLNGHTTQDTGYACPDWPDLHPFIASHYVSVDPAAGTCAPTGATGSWWAASGTSDGPEQWQVDLSAYAGKQVELSISYASDSDVQYAGVYVDDVVVSTGAGSTSFEDGLDGWTVPGPPAGSPGNTNDWTVGTVDDVGPSAGDIAADAFAREPEFLGFLSDTFGRYPFRSAGGIVDDYVGLGFALETQTRPIYDRGFFTDPANAETGIVHELTHQWFGDSLTVRRWRDIWLNEGFATYAEWLWSEHEGGSTVQDYADYWYSLPADDPRWQLVIGDPGPDHLFDGPVYVRGAGTLQALRLTVGDDAFFRILRTWARTRAGDTVTTAEFIRLAEGISGQQLDDLFRAWLYTPGKPPLPAGAAQRRSAVGARSTPPAVVAAVRHHEVARR